MGLTQKFRLLKAEFSLTVAEEEVRELPSLTGTLLTMPWLV